MACACEILDETGLVRFLFPQDGHGRITAARKLDKAIPGKLLLFDVGEIFLSSLLGIVQIIQAA